MTYRNQISAVEAKQLSNKAVEDFVKEYLPKIMENVFEVIRSNAEAERTCLWNVDFLEDYRNQHVLRPIIAENLRDLGYKVTIDNSDNMTIDWSAPMPKATDDQPSQDTIVVRHGV